MFVKGYKSVDELVAAVLGGLVQLSEIPTSHRLTVEARVAAATAPEPEPALEPELEPEPKTKLKGSTKKSKKK